MNKNIYHPTFCCFLFFFLLTSAAAQEIVIEWQSPAGAQAASQFQGGLIPRANMLDYNDDGLNELTGITSNGVFRIVDGATQRVLVEASELAGVPLSMYRFFGFADMAGSEEKELTFVPGVNLEDDVLFTEVNTEFGTMQSGTGVQCPANDSLYWWCSYTGGWDADPYQEFAFYSTAGGYLVVGNGYTAGFQSPDPPSVEQLGSVMDCTELAVDWVSAPNVSWPSDEANLLPEAANDFNDNGVNDLAWIKDSLLYIMDPSTREMLLSGRLPAAAWAASPAPAPRVVGYFDFCGSGQKQVLIGWPTRNVSNIPMHRLSDLMIIDPARQLLDSLFVYHTSATLETLSSDPKQFSARAVADPDQDGKMELVMQHRLNRRLVTLELREEGKVQPPGIFSAATFATPVANSKTITDYEIVMKWETGPGLRPYFNLNEQFDGEQLDFDGDGDVEIVVWEENENDTLAIGCQVYDLQTQTLLWNFTFPVEAIGDTLRRFHGFHDVNADGETEALFGSRTIVTQDKTVRQPFGEFRIFAVLDMDSDGFPDVVGRTPDGRLQVWGAAEEANAVEGTIGVPDFSLSLFPNPAVYGQSALQLEIVQAGHYRWRLLDLQGRRLRDTDLGRLLPGTQVIPTGPLGDLPAGVYLIQLAGPTGARTVRLLQH